MTKSENKKNKWKNLNLYKKNLTITFLFNIKILSFILVI